MVQQILFTSKASSLPDGIVQTLIPVTNMHSLFPPFPPLGPNCMFRKKRILLIAILFILGFHFQQYQLHLQ